MYKSLLMTGLISTLIGGWSLQAKAQSTIVLYDQDFENPMGFVNQGGDINITRTINNLYSNQPPGFIFTQAFTVETLLLTGNQAFGSGYSDPSGIGGNYALGMLSTGQNDLLGLSFDTGGRDFLNFRLDISSIDLDRFGGPFVPNGAIPEFEFTLFDNPSGTPNLGSGSILSTFTTSGTPSARNVFDWTEVLAVLDASGSTNGNVTLRIDLLNGGYAALDNFRITASDTPGDIGVVPEPLTILGAGTAIAFGTGFKRKLGKANKK